MRQAQVRQQDTIPVGARETHRPVRQWCVTPLYLLVERAPRRSCAALRLFLPSSPAAAPAGVLTPKHRSVSSASPIMAVKLPPMAGLMPSNDVCWWAY